MTGSRFAALRWSTALVAFLGALAMAGVSVRAEVVQSGPVRVNFEGELRPKALPRTGSAPVRVSVGAKIASVNGGTPPQLRTLAIAVNSAGTFDPSLLPKCTLRDIQPSTTQNAFKACGASLVGKGTFRANLLIGQGAAFPASGELFAFNGTFEGHPAILAHVYGTNPVPTSFTLPFELLKTKGTYGTVLRASLPAVTGKSGYITELSLDLGRTIGSGAKRRSYLNASCPAPKGFDKAPFKFAKATFGFVGRTVTSTLARTCVAGGGQREANRDQ